MTTAYITAPAPLAPPVNECMNVSGRAHFRCPRPRDWTIWSSSYVRPSLRLALLSDRFPYRIHFCAFKKSLGVSSSNQVGISGKVASEDADNRNKGSRALPLDDARELSIRSRSHGLDCIHHDCEIKGKHSFSFQTHSTGMLGMPSAPGNRHVTREAPRVLHLILRWCLFLWASVPSYIVNRTTRVPHAVTVLYCLTLVMYNTYHSHTPAVFHRRANVLS